MGYFDEVKKNFGFGLMRLPMAGDGIDYDETCRMVDAFIEAGFNYFDTAHGYHDGLSEVAVKRCLTDRYPRDKYMLTNKLSNDYFDKQEDIRPFFDSQLAACGVDYFDFYLMHAQTATYYEKYKRCRAYETALELKAEGKIKHFGISFHDSADVLDKILTEYPEIEAVQLQINYLDYEDSGIQGRLCYEVCRRHSKPVIVMEPVKGGSLVNLPPDADRILRELNGGSNASYAIRYAADLEGVFMVLSGMSNMAQLEDNISYMADFQPLTGDERAAIARVVEIFRTQNMIACTSCRYCTAGCPEHILIPDLFADYNSKKTFNNWNSDYYYTIHTQFNGKAQDCIQCGKCERICPQKLPIRALLKKVSAEFDKLEAKSYD